MKSSQKSGWAEMFFKKCRKTRILHLKPQRRESSDLPASTVTPPELDRISKHLDGELVYPEGSLDIQRCCRQCYKGCAEKTVFFFCEVGPHCDPRTQPTVAVYLSFKFVGDYLGVQPPYLGPRPRSASTLLFDPDPSWQIPSSAPYLCQHQALA